MSTVQIMVKACLGGLALGLAGCGVLPSSGAATAAVWTPALAQGACRDMAGEQARLQAVQAALARQGLALRVLDCPQLTQAAGVGRQASAQVIAVTVMVVDGERAADVVRGPLADGEAVDMGSAVPVPAATQKQAQAVSANPTALEPSADALSPDVVHNRAWLRAAMAAQGFKPVAGCWWAFLPR